MSISSSDDWRDPFILEYSPAITSYVDLARIGKKKREQCIDHKLNLSIPFNTHWPRASNLPTYSSSQPFTKPSIHHTLEDTTISNNKKRRQMGLESFYSQRWAESRKGLSRWLSSWLFFYSDAISLEDRKKKIWQRNSRSKGFLGDHWPL